MVAEPVATPVATPDALTEIMAGLLLAHVPPPTVDDNDDDVPIQTNAKPEIVPAVGAGLTDTV